MIRLQQLLGGQRVPRLGRGRQQQVHTQYTRRIFLGSSSNSSSRFVYYLSRLSRCRNSSLSAANNGSRYAPSLCRRSCCRCCSIGDGSTSSSACGFSSSCHPLTHRIGSCSRGNDNAYSRTAILSSSRRRSDNIRSIVSTGYSSRRSISGSNNAGASNKLSGVSGDGGRSRCCMHAEDDIRNTSYDGSRTNCGHGDSSPYTIGIKKSCSDVFHSINGRWVAGHDERMPVGIQMRTYFDATMCRGSSAVGRETAAAAAREVALLCRVHRLLPVLIAKRLRSRGRQSTLFSSYTGSSASMCYYAGSPVICLSRISCSTFTTVSKFPSASAWLAAVATGSEFCRMSSAAACGLTRPSHFCLISSAAGCGRTGPSHFCRMSSTAACALARPCSSSAMQSNAHAEEGPHEQQQLQQMLQQRQIQQHGHQHQVQHQHREAVCLQGCELLRCTDSRQHEYQISRSARPYLLSSPPRSFLLQQLKVNQVLAGVCSLSTAFPVATVRWISYPRPGERGPPRASCFFSSTNNNRSSSSAAAESGEYPATSRPSTSPAQQPAATSAASNAGTSSSVQQQQTYRPQPPLQPHMRSPITSGSPYVRRRTVAGSSSPKWWSVFSVYGICRLGFRLISSLWSALLRGARVFFKYARMILSNPMVVKKFWRKGKESAIHTWRWTVTGFSLFYANVRVSYQLLKKKILGHPLRYNEHKLLVRTTADALKLIPFSLMIVIPLGELLLPVMLRLFPNMLPSTFFEKQVDNAYLSRKLKAKQELAAFFQELVREHTKHIIEHESNDALKDRAKALREFQEKLLRKDQKDVNPFLSLKDILSFAKLFKEEFVLEKLDLQTLQVMCKLLGIEPYSLQSHVILQLRYHLNNIQREDREFMWEGVETLSHDELVEACKDRAMMFHSISDEDMREQMRQWLEISSHKDIPPLLLLWCRCITLTHRPIPPPAVDLTSSASAAKAGAAAGKAPAAAPAAAGGAAGVTAAGDGVLRAGAAATAPTADTGRSGEKEPGLAAAPVVAPSTTSTAATATSLQQQPQQRAADAASSGQLPSHQQQEAERFATVSNGEQLLQHTPAAQAVKHHEAAAEGSGPVEGATTAATPQGQQADRQGEKREDEDEEAEDEHEKMKAATLEAMERQVELLRAEEETLRQSVLLLQEEEAQRKKIQADEAAEAHVSEIEHKAAVVGDTAETPAAGEGSSTGEAASTVERREQQQQQMRGRPAVLDESRDGSAAAAAASAAIVPAGPAPVVEGEDTASLNELARVRSGREMLQRRARRMELELRLLRRLADMQHHQQEQAFGALSKVLQAAHACRVKQQAMQQLVQLRAEQQHQRPERAASRGMPETGSFHEAGEHLQQHLEAERDHQLEVQRQQTQREGPAAAAATAAVADFPETVTQLELCVEDVIRKFAEGVQQVEQLMRDAKRFQMNDSDPLFYPEDHSDMEDVPTLPVSPPLAHAQQSHAVLSGPPSSSVSSSSSPPTPPSTSCATGTYSTVIVPTHQALRSTRNSTVSGTEVDAGKQEQRKAQVCAAASHP